MTSLQTFYPNVQRIGLNDPYETTSFIPSFPVYDIFSSVELLGCIYAGCGWV